MGPSVRLGLEWDNVRKAYLQKHLKAYLVTYLNVLVGRGLGNSRKWRVKETDFGHFL